MRINREVPLNPNVVVYHVDHALTTAVVEAYRNAPVAPIPFSELLILGAESVHVTRYRFMVRKPRLWAILDFLRATEPALCAWSGCDAIPAAPDRVETWRSFDVTYDPTSSGLREVYEGWNVARMNPVADDLFALAGVTEVVLTPVCVTAGKGVLFDWASLAPGVERILARHAPTEKDA